MKGFWVIVVLMMVLMPFFMFSIDKDKKKIEKRRSKNDRSGYSKQYNL